MTGPMGSELDWRDGQPVSRRYGDVYFSRESGIAETRHVFLAGNRLRERWAALPPGGRFTIGETGFGTGLNFCAAWQLWESEAPQDAVLRYVSFERFPLSPDELIRALALWPELAHYAHSLAGQYTALAPGWHRFHLAGGRVLLTLAIGDANATLDELAGRCDAWFLDGFAPAKNPELWTANLLGAIGAHSRAGATLATYSVAATVREGLHAAGFRVDKKRGFGRKREMLVGERDGGSAALSQPLGSRRAMVIGGGLAGAASAWSLAARGWQITLLEREASLARGASGNPQGVLYARLAGRPTLLGELTLAGYAHSLRMLNALLPQSDDTWRACGVLQLALDEKTAARQGEVAETGLPASLVRRVDRAEASALAGIDLPAGGLYFAGAGWVHPAALVRALTGHPRIDVRTGADVVALERDANGEWRAIGANFDLASAPVTVIAASAEAARFPQTRHLPLHAVRGQITQLAETPASRALRAVVCGEASITPARGGMHTLGATFVHEFDDLALHETEHRQNLADLAAMAPTLAAALGADTADPAQLAGRAAVRCTSPDRLPLAGEVRPGGGLCVSTAHGSRGLITPPLSGEVLAAVLEDEPAPVSSRLLAALDPARFAPPA
ncbi:MAG: bifunctional tRNA (5-methylaminomethyl-2-thiouridine)(34)-methyltransferase MnmD/FAD-dependent 5-carboxymethylaminomethyl-2-thiouridine(34) oxidoreductase MnmC [Betaproteobacteria bacterium]|nr:bifunctional tRNA (5-methylaminomethyl-2-thiouridine)(34)-methyltransferase MnmD/FAD-dependent 5-carboxymethylaminomethyl-2-thiouridine(34) oxidoreductase MnmC [Betaproteobacteria bacterium]